MSSSRAKAVAIKAVIRRQALETRQSMDPSRHQQASAEMSERLAQLALERGWRRILVFLPWRAEPDLRPLWQRWRRLDCQLGLPVVQGPQAELFFAAWPETEALRPDALGLPAPLSLQEFAPDCWVVPCVAVDQAGHRLGAGKGFYDRTLAARHPLGTPRPYLVGVCFEAGRLDLSFAEPHDLRLDWLITEAGEFDHRGEGPA